MSCVCPSVRACAWLWGWGWQEKRREQDLGRYFSVAQLWKAWRKCLVLHPPRSSVADAEGKQGGAGECWCFRRLPGQQPSKGTASGALTLCRPSPLFLFRVFRFYIFRATWNYLSHLFPTCPHTSEDLRDTWKKAAEVWRHGPSTTKKTPLWPAQMLDFIECM